MPITINRRDFTAMLLATGTTSRYRRPVSTPDPVETMPPATITINMFSKGLEWMDYDRLTDTLVAAGFTGIDLTVRGGGHVLPENVERDLPKVVEIAKAKGLAIPMMVTSIVDPGNPMTERILKTASQAGIRHYRMGYLSYDPKLSIQETFQKHKSTLQRLADLNHTYGIQAGYQNHQGTNLGLLSGISGILFRIWTTGWLVCNMIPPMLRPRALTPGRIRSASFIPRLVLCR
ncbi:hypothetical protein GO730_38270 [Spirosoma sp. HMF3257]|uniref:Sugar phosphate isomerase/epimerase n=1 Tax=Spirosoma telluris TaxID=2183553 RepID=A0A327NCJ2_9BACT|nr:hypothetical protein [Spirosoma telluris]RAI72960.1 hypothetical protein HMF3257_38175 [Spirosoma telluris]